MNLKRERPEDNITVGSITVGNGEVILPGRPDRLRHNGMTVALSSIASFGLEARQENGVTLYFAIVVLHSGVTVVGVETIESGQRMIDIWRSTLHRE